MADRIMGIGFTGQMKSGKDTASEILEKWFSEIHGGIDLGEFVDQDGSMLQKLDLKRFAFADQLKTVCIAGLGLQHDDVYTQDGKMAYNQDYGMTNREILQKVGDGLRNYMYPDIWVKITERKIRQFQGKVANPFFIITDVRYPNEAEMIHRLGGKVIQITRPETDAKNPKHTSEVPLHGGCVDVSIVNGGTLDDFRESLYDAFDRFSIIPGNICLNC